MLQHTRSTTCDAERALLRNAGAAANVQTGTPNKREACMRCGQLRHVISTIPVWCVEGCLVLAPLCGRCTREVSK
jgi:hypothetical protein